MHAPVKLHLSYYLTQNKLTIAQDTCGKSQYGYKIILAETLVMQPELNVCATQKLSSMKYCPKVRFQLLIACA